MPLKTYGCSICGEQAPRAYRKHDMFKKRMSWLRHHYMLKHPKKWPWKGRNPFAEGLVSGAGIGAGWAAGSHVVEKVIKKIRKKNPRRNPEARRADLERLLLFGAVATAAILLYRRYTQG